MLSSKSLWQRLRRVILPERTDDQTTPIVGEFYIRSGSCGQCGKCCQNIHLVYGDTPVSSVAQFEHLKPINPEYRYFVPVDETDHGLVFRCVNLQPDNTCGIYENRPDFCRRYPTEQNLLQGGELAEGCGFRFTPIRPFQSLLAPAPALRTAQTQTVPDLKESPPSTGV